MNWLDPYLSRIIKSALATLPSRAALKFVGLDVTDDSITDETIVTNALAVKMAGGGNANMQRVADVAYTQTTNGTIADLYTWAVRDEAVTLLRVEVLAVKSDGTKTASFVRWVRFKSDAATVSVGTPANTLAETEASFGVSITTDNNGTTGRLRVTGLAATTIDWYAWVERFEGAHA